MVLKLLVCGGGNGAHVLSGIAAAQPDTESRVLTLYADEADRWTEAMKGKEFIITKTESDGSKSQVKAKPLKVSKNPEEVVPGSDIIVLTVPAFAHAQYIEALKPYVRPGVVIVGLPGRAGLDFCVRGIWGEKASEATIIVMESLPWACRISEFGRSADVLGTKSVLNGAVHVGHPAPDRDAGEMLQQCLGPHPALTISGHLLGISMMVTNGCLHPTVMYGQWKDWGGQPVKEAPQFYHGISEETAKLLEAMSDEVLVIAKSIMEQRPGVDLSNVDSLYSWFQRCYVYDMLDNSTLHTSITTNSAYTGLTHPLQESADGTKRPNFKYRYLTEDIPCGLAVIRGIAEIAGVRTPNIDMVMTWAQDKIGKEYLREGEFKGTDLKETRCPQRYGLLTLDAILGS